MKTGKSVSQEHPFGVRRQALDENGYTKILAPRHFRKLGRHYMDDVTDDELASVYFGVSHFSEMEKKNIKIIQTHKGQVTRLSKEIAALSVESEDSEIHALLQKKRKHEEDIVRLELLFNNLKERISKYREGGAA